MGLADGEQLPKKLTTKSHIMWREQKCIKEKLRQGLKRRMLPAVSIKGGLCGCHDALWSTNCSSTSVMSVGHFMNANDQKCLQLMFGHEG